MAALTSDMPTIRAPFFAAIVAALLPIVIFGGNPGLEIVRPTAIVILGGLIASTLFTLLILPALYLIIGSGAERQTDLGLSEAST